MKTYKPFIPLALFGVMVPILFAWIVELVMIPKEGIYLTNGFWDAKPLVIYHLAMYLNIFTCFAMAMLIIHFIIYREKEN